MRFYQKILTPLYCSPYRPQQKAREPERAGLSDTMKEEG